MAPFSFKPLMPHPTAKSRTSSPSVWSRVTSISSFAVVTLAIALALFSLPTVIAVDLKFARSEAPKPAFPVTVNPRTQTITEDPEVEAFLDTHNTSLQASVNLAGDYLTKLALFISSLPVYQSLAGASASGLVEVKAGYREEEVATVFAQQLGWNAAQKRVFLKQLKVAEPVMNEGEFVPGVYPVRGLLMTPGDVQIMLNERFLQEIKNRYSTTTERQVPLADALTIASMLEKETKDPEEMRIISGIIWNRLWIGMKLQIDATLQYAKASTDPSAKSWWPKPLPKDKYIKSPYNTYQNKGLPPGPISNPSTAAVLAALNPKKTDCLFYFHDSHGVFHCTETYKQHVTLLRKYYGQGK